MDDNQGRSLPDQRKHREDMLSSLYQEYYEKIARYAYARIGNRIEAEDLAGEVFLRALKSLGSYQERDLPMQAWLFKIAHNLVVDYFRKAAKQKTVPIDDTELINLSKILALLVHV